MDKLHSIPEITITYSHPNKSKIKVISSFQAYEVFMQYFPAGTIELQERLVVMYLNQSNQILGIYQHSIGGMTSCIVDIRLILAIALKTAAISVTLAHNHPTGTLKASVLDIDLTNRLKQACALMDLKLLDHIIISPVTGQFYSFSDEGIL
jgi:DNA repair protein RadC